MSNDFNFPILRQTTNLLPWQLKSCKEHENVILPTQSSSKGNNVCKVYSLKTKTSLKIIDCPNKGPKWLTYEQLNIFVRSVFSVISRSFSRSFSRSCSRSYDTVTSCSFITWLCNKHCKENKKIYDILSNAKGAPWHQKISFQIIKKAPSFVQIWNNTSTSEGDKDGGNGGNISLMAWSRCKLFLS